LWNILLLRVAAQVVVREQAETAAAEVLAVIVALSQVKALVEAQAQKKP
jgi:hypothetical protein